MTTSISYDSIDILRGDIGASEKTAYFSSLFSKLGDWVIGYLRKKPIREFTRLYIELEGVHKIVIDLEQVSPDPNEDYRIFSGLVNVLTKINKLYRSIDYMDSSQLEQLMNDTLSLSYEIEAELKVRALSSKELIKTDDNLKKALSANSRFAIAKQLSIQK
jgi:hypothetical protein